MILKSKIDCNSCSNKDCLIQKHLSSEIVQKLIQKKSTIACKKGQQFILEGAPINGLFFVQNGKSKVFKTGIYGKEQILRFVKNGEIIGHRGFGISNHYSISAVALENTILCNFSNEVLNELLLKIPKLTYDFMLFYAEELNKSESKVKSIAQMTVREKVIDTILYIHRKFGENPKGLLNIQLSRKEIADFAGTTDEQVIRTISSLKKEELLKASGKQIGIINVSNLKKEISEHNFYLNS